MRIPTRPCVASAAPSATRRAASRASALAHGAVAAATIALAACGGGGGSSGSSSPAPGTSYPTSGPYGWILKATGPTSALKYGLSLVHPSQTDTEYVIEPGSGVVTDASLVSTATLSPSALTASGIQPAFLVYVVGGDVRSVAMQANGTAPATSVQRAQSTSACRFMITGVDYATPANSRFVVSTAGADGQCDKTDNGDDGRAEVKLSSTLGVTVTPFTGEVPLGLYRDPVTLAPSGWIYSRTVGLWSSSGPSSFQTRASSAPAITRVVGSTPNAALVEDSTKLAVLTFAGGTSVSETALDPTLTGGGNWQLIGFDAGNFYVYRNSGTDFSSTWTVLRIGRASPVASVLATGTGLVSLAAMGKTVVYLTVFGPSDNELVRIAKAGGAPAVASTATTTLTTVLTSAAGVNEVWTVTGVGSTPSYRVDFVDESGSVLYTATSGFPLSVAEAGTVHFDASENRNAFVVAANYGARSFGDATLVVYDAAAQAARTMGNFPGMAKYGNDFVFANAVAGPTSQGLAFAARTVNGSLQDSDAEVLSFDLGTANSLTATSRAQ